MSRKRIAILLALLAFPIAGAAAPTPVPWAAHETSLRVNDLAIGGPTIAAALDVPATPPVGTAPNDMDLAILDVDGGFAKGRPSTTFSTSFGRNLTAVSADGRTVASVGNGTATATPPACPAAPCLRLQVQRLASGTRWSNASTDLNATFTLENGTAVDLLVSDDGNRVALAVQTSTNVLVVAAFTTSGTAITSQFTLKQTGVVYDLAATPDLGTIAVATQLAEADATYATVLVVPFSTGTPASFVDRSANGAYRSVGISADGTRTFTGDLGGRLRVFAGVSPSLPVTLPAAAGPVTHLAVAEDASRIAAVIGSVLVVLDGTRAPPAALYNATAPGVITKLAANRTGATIVVAAGAAVVGYGDLDATPLWTLPSAGPAVAMDRDGTTIAYLPTATKVAVARLQRNITFEHQAGGDTSPARAVRPQGSVTFPLVVRNVGSAVERVSFAPPRDVDVSVSIQPTTVAVNPEQTALVNVTVTTGPLFSGTRAFSIAATSLTSAARDETTLTVELQDEPDVRFLLNGTNDISMKAGDTYTFNIGVQNNGSTDAAVGIRGVQTVTSGPLWTVTIDPASLTLAPSSITTVRVSVSAPPTAVDGTASTVRFVLEGVNVSDEVTLAFRVNPKLGVEVNAAGRVKFVEPGGVAFYNITVTNTGTLPRRFEAFFEANEQGERSWAVDMDTSSFRLDPTASRTILVRIFAPQDAVPNVDRVSVLVRARSFPEQVNETFAEANVTLFANAVPKPVTTTTPEDQNGIPFPATAALAGVALAALLSRRRRP